MPTLYVTTKAGESFELPAELGLSALDVIRRSGSDELLAICGGNCSCATCHVYVDPDCLTKLDPASEAERELLSSLTHRQATSRLSCQIRVNGSLDGLKITIAPEE